MQYFQQLSFLRKQPILITGTAKDFETFFNTAVIIDRNAVCGFSVFFAIKALMRHGMIFSSFSYYWRAAPALQAAADRKIRYRWNKKGFVELGLAMPAIVCILYVYVVVVSGRRFKPWPFTAKRTGLSVLTARLPL
ncbi:hypothetical protein [Paenibacillus elgii]|uniref:hypothetical protein n=1 Tax=Paenibacillus elgii TaxID=189691 RepID=UPI0030DD5794